MQQEGGQKTQRTVRKKEGTSVFHHKMSARDLPDDQGKR